MRCRLSIASRKVGEGATTTCSIPFRLSLSKHTQPSHLRHAGTSPTQSSPARGRWRRRRRRGWKATSSKERATFVKILCLLPLRQAAPATSPWRGRIMGLDKPAQIMYARCVHWLRPKDKTGAKLVSMHETVTSPTEYRSRHEALRLSWRCRRRGGELRGRVGGLGVLPRSFGGNLRPRPQLPDGIVWGGPGRCWRGITLPGA